jgi:gas vesicle protein
MNKETATALGVGVITGFLAGAVVALLYAPKTGTETREIIRGRAISLRDKAIETKDKAINLIKRNREES